MKVKRQQKFKVCIVCNRPLVKPIADTDKFLPVYSKYPFCGPCMWKKSHDPEFIKWVYKKINASYPNNNKSNTALQR